MYACLVVTCHLHFWQNDLDFLRATVVTWGWNGYRNKSQHRKSTLEKRILPPFQQGFEPATFQSRVRRSNHWAIPAIPVVLLSVLFFFMALGFTRSCLLLTTPNHCYFCTQPQCHLLSNRLHLTVKTALWPSMLITMFMRLVIFAKMHLKQHCLLFSGKSLTSVERWNQYNFQYISLLLQYGLLETW